MACKGKTINSPFHKRTKRGIQNDLISGISSFPKSRDKSDADRFGSGAFSLNTFLEIKRIFMRTSQPISIENIIEIVCLKDDIQ